MRGKLIIIEGGDGSGKATQTAMLVERLAAEGRPVRSVSFPDYDSDSSALVKMYLRGDFGSDADGVNPYAASAFYAVDRFASYQTQWKSFLQDGGIVVADRYTTSNMLYQMIKIDDAAAQEAYLDWLWDFEFGKAGPARAGHGCPPGRAPGGDGTAHGRTDGKTGGRTGDIHEKNEGFLRKCHDAYDVLAKRYGWQRIACADGLAMRTPEAICDDVYEAVRTLWK